MDISLIIVAAGFGRRLGGVDKAFVKIAGKEIILYSFETFEKVPQIKEKIIVVNKENVDKAKSVFHGKNVKFVFGGSIRAESVKNGVLAAKERFVMVHDAARPFVSVFLIERVINALKDADSVIPTLKVKPTIKIVENSFVSKTLNRNTLAVVQTPQLFRKEQLLSAYEKFADLSSITDESMLIEKLGKRVRIVEGEETNLKITTPLDLIVAREIVKNGI